MCTFNKPGTFDPIAHDYVQCIHYRIIRFSDHNPVYLLRYSKCNHSMCIRIRAIIHSFHL